MFRLITEVKVLVLTTVATVCHIFDGRNLLLQLKSTGLFGEGKWNGVGGKLRTREPPVEGAIREVLEETGLVVSNLKSHGILSFFFGQRIDVDWEVHVFSTSDFKGNLNPSNEGSLKWFDIDEIPYDAMWKDDRHWLPLLLKGKVFQGVFYFNKDGNKLLDFHLQSSS